MLDTYILRLWIKEREHYIRPTDISQTETIQCRNENKITWYFFHLIKRLSTRGWIIDLIMIIDLARIIKCVFYMSSLVFLSSYFSSITWNNDSFSSYSIISVNFFRFQIPFQILTSIILLLLWGMTTYVRSSYACFKLSQNRIKGTLKSAHILRCLTTSSNSYTFNQCWVIAFYFALRLTFWKPFIALITYPVY